jgi:hypothetical protein
VILPVILPEFLADSLGAGVADASWAEPVWPWHWRVKLNAQISSAAHNSDQI